MQEFEQINGYYSVPELIRKPVDPVKAESAEKEKVAPTDASTAAATTEKDSKEDDKKVTSNSMIVVESGNTKTMKISFLLSLRCGFIRSIYSCFYLSLQESSPTESEEKKDKEEKENKNENPEEEQEPEKETKPEEKNEVLEKETANSEEKNVSGMN